MKKLALIVVVNIICTLSYGQSDSEQYAHNLFRGTRIINGHSVETLKEGEMEMIIGHRFGRLNGGAYELFGIDQANIRLGLDYGIKNGVNIGIGRSSLGKEFDGFLKLRLLRQAAKGHNGSPVSVTAFSSIAYNSLKNANPERPLSTYNRLAYVHQLFIARKITDQFSMQLMPAIAHYNLVENRSANNDVVVVGLSGKYQITKNLAVTSEYYYALPGHLPDNRKNSFAVGFDLNTGSHVFQLHFTNSGGMIEKQFIGETTGVWGNGDIHFGFNMVRTFKLKGRRY